MTPRLDDLTRWKRTVVNVEGAADTESFWERDRHTRELWMQVQRGELTPEEFAERDRSTRFDKRYLATAIFLEHEARYYLITAWHVLHDSDAAEADVAEYRRREAEDGGTRPPGRESPNAFLLQLATERVFGNLYRVQSLDEVIADTPRSMADHIMNLASAPLDEGNFTAADPAHDLVVVSLNSTFDRPFAKRLLELGYQPISLSDIEDGPSSEGTDVFAVGFPYSMAVLGSTSATNSWSESSHVSLPTFAFGRVSMLHDRLHYFWADLSVYPGNSGGPVVEGDKLVGVVSANASVPLDVVNPADGSRLPVSVAMRAPFGKASKAGLIRPLIAEQVVKDQRREMRQERMKAARDREAQGT